MNDSNLQGDDVSCVNVPSLFSNFVFSVNSGIIFFAYIVTERKTLYAVAKKP